MDRVILHCDCNAFFASVEAVAQPWLNDVPMAVCGDPEDRRGIILAKNELAKGFGIITAETVWQARQKCPGLVLVPPHQARYREYSKKINAIYEQYTDQVEAFSVDESWLDVTGSQHLFGTGREIADTLRRRIREELGLTISVGVSFNKIFAKLGSDYKKPDATTEISRENYKTILWPLPAGAMLFVGRAAADKLSRFGIMTIGDIARAGQAEMEALLGKSGATIWEYAMGLADSPVKRIGESDPVKSVGNGVTFRRNLVTLADIKAGLTMLADEVGGRLRREGLYCMSVQVQIKDPSLKVISRQRALNSPTNATRVILDTALSIVEKSWRVGDPIRLLSVTAGSLTCCGATQMSLLEDPEKRDRLNRLDAAVDKIRERYGKASVQYGVVLKTDIGGHLKPEEKGEKGPGPY